MIYEVKSYSDNEGRRVSERTPINKDIVNPIYDGVIIMNTEFGNVPVPFSFPCGYTLEKCFEDFDKLAFEKISEIKKSSNLNDKKV
jgi:hypothetical protein